MKTENEWINFFQRNGKRLKFEDRRRMKKKVNETMEKVTEKF